MTIITQNPESIAIWDPCDYPLLDDPDYRRTKRLGWGLLLVLACLAAMTCVAEGC